jgi:hypothetical protein
MASLDTAPRFSDPDGAYRLIVEALRPLDAEASAAFTARLALILANHIGDAKVLAEAVALAQRTG